MEATQKLKQELLEKISRIDDYDILQALNEYVQVYERQQKTEGAYDFPGATKEEWEPLLWEVDSNVEVIPSEVKEKPFLQPTSVKKIKPSQMRGFLSESTAEAMQQHIEQSRKEWDNF